MLRAPTTAIMGTTGASCTTPACSHVRGRGEGDFCDGGGGGGGGAATEVSALPQRGFAGGSLSSPGAVVAAAAAAGSPATVVERAARVAAGLRAGATDPARITGPVARVAALASPSDLTAALPVGVAALAG